jgi:leader peptidase (prepilin peptidase) / N-methyltransferase
MIDPDAGEAVASADDDLRPNPVVLAGGAAAIGIVSALSLPWPVALASTVLGTLMIAGADVDARTFLLPDPITWGALVCGIVAAPLLDGEAPWASACEAMARAGCIALVLALFRGGYAWIRRSEGLGLGDVKLAAAIGAWLPIEAIPLCFGLATSGALLMVMFAHFNGQPVTRTTRIPFGTFLCPALWIVFYGSSVTR